MNEPWITPMPWKNHTRPMATRTTPMIIRARMSCAPSGVSWKLASTFGEPGASSARTQERRAYQCTSDEDVAIGVIWPFEVPQDFRLRSLGSVILRGTPTQQRAPALEGLEHLLLARMQDRAQRADVVA